MVTLDEVMIIMKKVLAEIAYLPERIRIASNQIVVTSLSEISETLGLVKAGEFRSGNNKEPGTGFSGLRIMYPPFRHEDKEWNLAGFENDVLKVGVSASDGSLYGIEGRWWLNEREMGMLHTEEARAPLINWRTSDGSTAGNIRSVETANENNVTIASWGTPTSGRIRSRVVLYAANAGEISNLIVDNTGELIFNSIPARFYAGKPGIMTFTTAQADFAVGNGGMNFTSSEPNFLLDGGPQRMYFFGPQVSFLVEGPGKMSFVSPQANLLVESPGRMHFFGDQTEMRWEQEGVYQDGFRLDVIPAEGVLSTSTSDPFPPATTNVSVVQFVEFGRRSVGIWDGTRWRPNSFSNGIFDRANLQRSLTNCSFTAGSAVVSFSVADDSLHLASRMEWFGGAEFAAGAKIISVSYANNTVTMDSNSTLTGVATGSWRVPANTHLDAFAIRRPGTSSAAVIEMCLWNGTTRVEPLAFRDGILVKSTDHTRTYLGTIKTTTAGRTDTEFIYNQTFPYKNLATFIPNVPATGGGGASLFQSFTNRSAAGVVKGDVLVFDTNFDSSVQTTTISQDLRVAGVANASIAANASGAVDTISGVVVDINCTADSVQRGEFLVTSSTVGRAQSAGFFRVPAAFAIALTGKIAGSVGVVRALLCNEFRQAIGGGFGWSMGGRDAPGTGTLTNAQRLTFASETWHTVAGAALPAARQSSGGIAEGGVSGYTIAGSSTTIDSGGQIHAYKTIFATETTAAEATANTAAGRHRVSWGGSAAIKGYIGGGNDTGGVVLSTTDRIIYATSTRTANGALSSARMFQRGQADGSFIYLSGGSAVTCDRITVSTDAVAAFTSANLVTAAEGYQSLSFPALAGYMTFRSGATIHSRKLPFATGTGVAHGGLTQDQTHGSGNSDNINIGYISGDVTSPSTQSSRFTLATEAYSSSGATALALGKTRGASFNWGAF